MDTIRQDLIAAIRSLKRSPGFTAVVVGTLAIAIGPLTAIFSVVDAVLLRPLPFDRPDRIVQVWVGEGSAPHGPTSSANFIDWRAMNRSFEAIAAEDFASYNLTSDAEGARPERLRGAVVSPSFFRVVGTRAALGRGLTVDDERADAHVAVLSYGLWTRRFAGDVHIVGREILLDGTRWQIVGVMPATFTFPGPLVEESIDLWTPLAWSPSDVQRGMRRHGVTARLRPGVTLAQAQSDLDRVGARLAADYPTDNGGTRIRLVPIREELAGGARRALLVLLGAVVLLLLVACANAANLMLARAATRDHEMSIRVALGAGRGRIVRQLLTETGILSTLATALGVLAALWIIAVYGALVPIGTRADVSLDGRVLGFVVTTALATGLAFGLVPAWRASTTTVGQSLRRDGRSSTATRARRRFSSALVVFEVAIAVVLLVGAGLLVRSFGRLTGNDVGFDARETYVARISLPSARYTDDRARQFVNDGLSRLRELRGVARAGVVDYLPFGQSDLHLGMTIEGQERAPHGKVSAHYRSIAGDYLGAMRIPLLRGRALTPMDASGAPLVALVSQTMARRYWPNENPIGQRIRVGSATDADPSPWLTVVGVVGDVKHWSFAEAAEPMVYASLEQLPTRNFTFVARLNGEHAATVASVREVLFTVDPEQPVPWHPLRELLISSVAEPRFRSAFIAGFGILALTLAIVGLYGLISFGVTQRTRELGVRVALGARHGDIVALVVREGMRLALAGILFGVAGAFLATRLLQGMLYHVSATDTVTFIAVPLVLMTTAAIANYLPARRAAKTDPVTALASP